MTRKKFTDEFRKESVQLAQTSGLTRDQVADDLGVGKSTLGKWINAPRTTFYRWYDRYQVAGPEALEDQSPRPSRVWNIPRAPGPMKHGSTVIAFIEDPGGCKVELIEIK